jgi:anti-sigma factor RsiW
VSEEIVVPCHDFVEQVTDYLEGTLDPDVRAAIDRHLAACDGCTAYLEQIRATIAQVGQVEDDALSPEAWDDLRAAFHALG